MALPVEGVSKTELDAALEAELRRGFDLALGPVFRARLFALSAEDRAEMELLRQTANRLEHRMESLETILDNEAPNWRKK